MLITFEPSIFKRSERNDIQNSAHVNDDDYYHYDKDDDDDYYYYYFEKAPSRENRLHLLPLAITILWWDRKPALKIVLVVKIYIAKKPPELYRIYIINF